MGHYKELFSRPGNDSETFYREGHKIIRMQKNTYKDRRATRKNNSRDHRRKLMESEDFEASNEEEFQDNSRALGKFIKITHRI